MRPLLHRRGGEARKADHVAGGIDMRHFGLEGLGIDREPPAIVDPEAAIFQAQRAGRAHAPGGEEQHLGADRAAVLQRRDDAAALVLSILVTLAPRRMATPRSRSWWVNSAMISRSTKSRNVSRGSIKVTATSSAEKIVAYSMPMTPAPMTARLRGTHGCSITVSPVDDDLVVEGDVVRAEGQRADGDDEALAFDDQLALVRLGHLNVMGIDEAREAAHGAHAVALELMLQHVDFMLQGHAQPIAEILAGNMLLNAIGAPIKAALAPTGEIEHGLAQRLGGNGAGMHPRRHPPFYVLRRRGPTCPASPPAPPRVDPRDRCRSPPAHIVPRRPPFGGGLIAHPHAPPGASSQDRETDTYGPPLQSLSRERRLCGHMVKIGLPVQGMHAGRRGLRLRHIQFLFPGADRGPARITQSRAAACVRRFAPRLGPGLRRGTDSASFRSPCRPRLRCAGH